MRRQDSFQSERSERSTDSYQTSSSVRVKLNLLPKKVTIPPIDTLSPSASPIISVNPLEGETGLNGKKKSNPFGNAKPVDVSLVLEKKAEEKKKLLEEENAKKILAQEEKAKLDASKPAPSPSSPSILTTGSTISPSATTITANTTILATTVKTPSSNPSSTKPVLLPKKKKSNPFGNAQPVDTREVEKKIEDKLARLELEVKVKDTTPSLPLSSTPGTPSSVLLPGKEEPVSVSQNPSSSSSPNPSITKVTSTTLPTSLPSPSSPLDSTIVDKTSIPPTSSTLTNPSLTSINQSNPKATWTSKNGGGPSIAGRGNSFDSPSRGSSHGTSYSSRGTNGRGGLSTRGSSKFSDRSSNGKWSHHHSTENNSRKAPIHSHDKSESTTLSPPPSSTSVTSSSNTKSSTPQVGGHGVIGEDGMSRVERGPKRSVEKVEEKKIKSVNVYDSLGEVGSFFKFFLLENGGGHLFYPFFITISFYFHSHFSSTVRVSISCSFR